MLKGTRVYAVDASNKTLLSSSSESKTALASPYVRSNRSLELGGYTTTANSAGGNQTGGGYSMGSTIVGRNNTIDLLDGFIPTDLKIRRRMFRNMYFNDPVSGGAVDIISLIPFSSFDLVGLESMEMLEVYQRSCESMRLNLMFPPLSKEYLVAGAFLATEVFDANEKIFTALMPQNIDNAEIREVPIYGYDPIIDLAIPPELSKMIKDKDPRVASILKTLPRDIMNNITNGKIPLSPDTTLFIPRRTLPSDYLGTSYLERALPIWLLEKTLYRGTLDQVTRRQRALTHIQVGEDEWIPDEQDLTNVRDLFLAADADPTGPIIVTRTGIMPQEFRQAEDFFRYDSIFDFATTAKYRALGISEELITGQLSVTSMDATLSIFMDQMRSYRNMLTRSIFYEKIFPPIAYVNNFTKDAYEATGSKLGRRFNNIRMDEAGRYRAKADGSAPYANIKDKNINMRDYLIPRVEWDKHLHPEGDTQYLELLDTLSQKGIPIPLTMMAAAGGVSLDSILNAQKSDLKLRKVLGDYMKKITKINEASGMQPSESSVRTLQALASAASPLPDYKNLIDREFDDIHQPNEISKSGKVKNTSRKRQQQIRDKANKAIAESMSKLAERERRIAKSKKKERPMLHGRYGIVK